MSKTGLLDGKDAISRYLDNASEHKLGKWVKDGMPVRIEGGRWLAHAENIEEFFRAYTRVNSKNRTMSS